MTKQYAPFQPLLTNTGLRAFSLKKQQYPVNAGLRGIVHSYLQVSSTKTSEYLVIPDGAQALFVSHNGTMISGGLTQSLALTLPGPGEYFGIRFYPGALRHFFPVNISEIGNCVIDGDFLPSPFAARLHETLYQHTSFQSRASVCDQWLLRQLARQPHSAFDEALACIYRSRGSINITQDLATQVGVSSRHLNRLFRLHTGFSTKSFAQTIRFQHASKYLSEQPGNSLNAALMTGYFDQSHLLNDFQKRLEESPVPFFSRFMSDFYNSPQP